MADEASDTFGGGVRNYLGAIGFISPLIGGEELVRLYLAGSGLPWWFSVVLIVGGLPIYLSPVAWESLRRLVGREHPKDKALEYLSDRDSQLGPAIITMAHKSAWGRWYAAQDLVNSGIPVGLQHLYQTAAGQVMRRITDGTLEVRGRRPDHEQLDFEPIDRTHWQSSWPACVRDKFAIWKIIIAPKGGVEFDQDGTIVRTDNPTAAQRTSLRDYDSLLVDAYQFEKLWPRRDALADKERHKFLRQSRRRDLDKDEIRRLSDPQWKFFSFLLSWFK